MRKLFAIVFLLPVMSWASWSNPNSNTVPIYTLSALSNGTLVGITRITADRFTGGEVTLDNETIDEWSDLSSILSLSSYLTSIGNSTAPTAPYGDALKSGSGPTPRIKYFKGLGGVSVTSDSDTVWFSGSATDSVSALFPVQTGSATRFYVRNLSSNMVPVDIPSSTNGYIFCDGTNYFAVSTVVGQSSNALLFVGQPPSYYLNFLNLTNFSFWDDGAFQASDAWGVEAGVNLDWQFVTRTNGGTTSTVARLNSAGGTGDLGRLTSSNYWTEWNGWEDDAYFDQRIIRRGNGVTMADGASVGIAGSNLVASGQQSTVAGGYNNTASGTKSAIGGGSDNTASDAGATVAGGRISSASAAYSTVGGGYDNNVAGQYSVVPGGFDVDVSGSGSFGFGRYVNNTNVDTVIFGWGLAATNRTTSRQDYSVLFARGDSNRVRVGINTSGILTNDLTVSGSMYASNYYGDFLGDISQASGAPASSNSQWRLSTLFGTNDTVRALEIYGAILTNAAFSGTTGKLYFGIGNVGTFTNFAFGGSNHTAQAILAAGPGITFTDNGTTSTASNAWDPTTNGYITGGIASNSFINAASSNSLFVLSQNETILGRPTFSTGTTVSADLSITNGYIALNGPSNAASGYVQFSDGTKQYTAGVSGSTVVTNETDPIAVAWIAANGVAKTSNNTYSAGTTQGFHSATFSTNGSISMGGIAVGPKNIFLQHSSPGSIGTNTIGSSVIGASSGTIGANCDDATIIGSASSVITSGDNSIIAGGNNHTSINNYNAIVGGQNDDIDGQYCFIGGGLNNDLLGNGNFDTIAGGQNNAMSGAYHSFIGAGSNNDINSADNAAIAGGKDNLIENSTGYGFIGAGELNRIYGFHSVIPGGYRNYCYADLSYVLGSYSMATGGMHQGAVGSGAYSRHAGSWVFSAGSATPEETNAISFTTNQFIFYAPNGVGISSTQRNGNPNGKTLWVDGEAVAKTFSRTITNNVAFGVVQTNLTYRRHMVASVDLVNVIAEEATAKAFVAGVEVAKVGLRTIAQSDTQNLVFDVMAGEAWYITNIVGASSSANVTNMVMTTY